MDRAARTRVRRLAGAFLFTPLLGCLLALAYVYSRPAFYEAVGRVRLVPSSLQAPAEPGLPPGYLYYGTYAARHNARADEIQMITSNTFLRGVAATLPRDLQKRLLVGEDIAEFTPAELSDELLGELSASLMVDTEPKNELFTVSFVHPDREVAAEMVNRVIREASEIGLRMGMARTARGATFFAGQIGALERQIREAQSRERVIEQNATAGGRQALHNAGGQYVFEFGGDDPDPELGPLMDAATRAHLEHRLAQGRVRLLAALSRDDQAASANSPALLELRTDLSEAEAEYAALGATLGASQPQMLGRAAEISRLREELSAASLARLRAARAQEAESGRNAKALDAEAARHVQALKAFQKEEVQDAMFEIDLALNLSVYEDIRARLQAAKINAGLGATDLQVIDEAQIPEKPLPRNPLIPVLGGLAAGLLLGFGAAFYLVGRGEHVWTVDEMEQRTALPVLTILSQQAGTVQISAGLAADYEDSLRTLSNEMNLLPAAFLGRKRGDQRQAQVLLFTSASPSEGKTATICSYAALLAQQGRRTLLLDADLHRPAVHRFFGLSGRAGMSTILSGRMNFAEGVLHPADAPKLDVVVAGPVAPSPSDLLGSKALNDLLEHARKGYDTILIDTPPVLALMDTLTLAPEADAILLVTRYGTVSSTQAGRARELLGRAGAPMAGVIVNGAPADR